MAGAVQHICFRDAIACDHCAASTTQVLHVAIPVALLNQPQLGRCFVLSTISCCAPRLSPFLLCSCVFYVYVSVTDSGVIFCVILCKAVVGISNTRKSSRLPVRSLPMSLPLNASNKYRAKIEASQIRAGTFQTAAAVINSQQQDDLEQLHVHFITWVASLRDPQYSTQPAPAGRGGQQQQLRGRGRPCRRRRERPSNTEARMPVAR